MPGAVKWRRRSWWEPRAPIRSSRPCPFVRDRKSTRLNSSHLGISYAVFCLKKKGHVEVGGDVLRRHAHVARVERIGQSPGHGVDGDAVAHPLAPAHVGQPDRK